MEELIDMKISIKVGGAQVYNEAPFFSSISEDKIILRTKIGRNEVKTLEIEIEKSVYVKGEKDGLETTKDSSDGSK